MNATLIVVIINNNMKTLTINNRTFEYERFYGKSEYGTHESTYFYQGTITKTHKKFWLFGPEIIEIKPKLVFKIYRDIEHKSYTKKQVRAWIQHEVDLLDREDEIRMGEII